jgi:hypothetical protein
VPLDALGLRPGPGRIAEHLYHVGSRPLPVIVSFSIFLLRPCVTRASEERRREQTCDDEYASMIFHVGRTLRFVGAQILKINF